MQLKFADVWHQKELDTFQAFPEYGMLTLGNWESGTRQIHTSLVDGNNLLLFFFLITWWLLWVKMGSFCLNLQCFLFPDTLTIPSFSVFCCSTWMSLIEPNVASFYIWWKQWRSQSFVLGGAVQGFRGGSTISLCSELTYAVVRGCGRESCEHFGRVGTTQSPLPCLSHWVEGNYFRLQATLIYASALTLLYAN